jgi:hypothetical protein
VKIFGFFKLINYLYLIELTGLQWQNSIREICQNQTKFCSYLKEFFVIQLDWMYEQIANYPDDEYWHQVKRIYLKIIFF